MKIWTRNRLNAVERKDGEFTIVVPPDPANGDWVRLQREIDLNEAEIDESKVRPG